MVGRWGVCSQLTLFWIWRFSPVCDFPVWLQSVTGEQCQALGLGGSARSAWHCSLWSVFALVTILMRTVCHSFCCHLCANPRQVMQSMTVRRRSPWSPQVLRVICPCFWLSLGRRSLCTCLHAAESGYPCSSSWRAELYRMGALP